MCAGENSPLGKERLAGVGSINIEDTTVVTEDGCEVLTSTPREWDAFL